MLRVKFVVHCKRLQQDQRMRIVGNMRQLGEWDPMNGLKMQEYYEGQWQSNISVGIIEGEEFDFKIVRILGGNEVQWQQLPNNSNRKFKPRFDSKLILSWSNNIGRVLNEGRSSLKLHGLPGVMVKDPKGGRVLKRKCYRNILQSSESQSDEQQNWDDQLGLLNGHRLWDIRQRISKVDIDQMYYQTTELEVAYNNYNKIQVNIVCRCQGQWGKFMGEIEEEVKGLGDLEDIMFRWIVLGDGGLMKERKVSYVVGGERMVLEEYCLGGNRNHFIFVDLESALGADVGGASACLYLDGGEYLRAIENITKLQRFQLICFNSGEANRRMFEYIRQKRWGSRQWLRYEQIQKNQRGFERMSVQKVIEQLQICGQFESGLNTVSNLSRNQCLAKILVQNSILVIDSELMRKDKRFFEDLTVTECQKRLIIIVHNGGMAEWMYNFNGCKNVCVIFENFSKLYFVGKIYDPCLKHRNVLQFIRMRAKLGVEEIGGEWVMDSRSFVYRIKQGSEQKFERIKRQIQNYVTKDFNYFKMVMRKGEFKISWNLANNLRIIRTLVRIKFMEEGLIGDFYLVSVGENLMGLKQEIKLLVKINSQKMMNGRQTMVLDFGYGDKINADYHIKSDGRSLGNCQEGKCQGVGVEEEGKDTNKVLVN